MIFFYLFVCIVLVVAILLQPGKAGDLGAASGGLSQTYFGGGGATPFLVKMTAVLGALFFLVSLSISLYSSPRGGSSIVTQDSK
jgi:preprotein translocase subunit SecG